VRSVILIFAIAASIIVWAVVTPGPPSAETIPGQIRRICAIESPSSAQHQKECYASRVAQHAFGGGQR